MFWEQNQERLAASSRLSQAAGSRANYVQGGGNTSVKLEDGLYEADIPYLRKCLSGGAYTERLLLEQPLHPDQMVFLTGSFSMDWDKVEEGQCVACSKTGRVLTRTDAQGALVMAEALTAVVFIIENIWNAGHSLSTMGEAAKRFIDSWESGKYRKSLAGKR